MVGYNHIELIYMRLKKTQFETFLQNASSLLIYFKEFHKCSFLYLHTSTGIHSIRTPFLVLDIAIPNLNKDTFTS